MPRLIKDGVVVENASQDVCTLEQWRALKDKSGSAVQIEPGDGVGDLLDDLDALSLVSINFPTFMDGRGFSYARELRERGYGGELRAVGVFMRDQLTYLKRVGFNAFELADEAALDDALASLDDFSEYYQASINQPEPLFRRR